MSGLLKALNEMRLDDVPALLAAGADVNEEDYYGNTPLLVAVALGRVDIVRGLIGRGAELEHKGITGATALNSATRYGHLEIACDLINAGANLYAESSVCAPPLLAAAINRHTDIVRLLFKLGVKITEPKHRRAYEALISAAENGDVEIIGLLLKAGASVNEKLDYPRTALDYAVLRGHVEAARFLIENGAELNPVRSYHGSPLHIAAQSGNAKMVSFLIEAGADIYITNDKFELPLTVASEEGLKKLIGMAGKLQRRGFDYIAACKQYKLGFAELAALSFWKENTLKGEALTKAFNDYISENSRYIDFLRIHSQHVNIDEYVLVFVSAVRKECVGAVRDILSTPQHAEIVARLNADPKRSQWILCRVVKSGNDELLSLLFKAGLKLVPSRLKLLHEAVAIGNVEIARVLLDAGADVDERADTDWTPLHRATWDGNIDLVRFLVSAGADVNSKTSAGETPVSFACRVRHTEILCHLLEAGASPGIRRDPRLLRASWGELSYPTPTETLLMKACYLNIEYGFDYVSACQQYKVSFAELAALPFWVSTSLEGEALTKAFRGYMWTERDSERKGFSSLLFKGQDKIAHNPVVPADVTDERVAALSSTIFHGRGRMIKPTADVTAKKTKAVEPWGRDVTEFLSRHG